MATNWASAQLPSTQPTIAMQGIAAFEAGKRARGERKGKALAKSVVEAWNVGDQTSFQRGLGDLSAVNPPLAKQIYDMFGTLDRTNFVESAMHMYNAAAFDDEGAQNTSIKRAIDTLGVGFNHPFVESLKSILNMPTASNEDKIKRNKRIFEAVSGAKEMGALPGGTGEKKFQKTSTFLAWDPEVNQYKLITGSFDPTTGQMEAAEGPIPSHYKLVSELGETPETTMKRKITEAGGKEAAKEAAKMATNYANKFDTVSKNLVTIDEGISIIKKGLDEGKFLGVGPLQKFIPKWTETSASLLNVADRLGLDIVSSVTFGQLSNKELELAKRTALPTNLKGPELLNWLEEKRSAMGKLSNYLREATMFIGAPKADASGVNTVGDWLKFQKEQKGVGGNQNVSQTPAVGPSNESIVYDAAGNTYTQQNGSWINTKTGQPYQPTVNTP